jgi:hypothetical protein
MHSNGNKEDIVTNQGFYYSPLYIPFSLLSKNGEN